MRAISGTAKRCLAPARPRLTRDRSRLVRRPGHSPRNSEFSTTRKPESLHFAASISPPPISTLPKLIRLFHHVLKLAVVLDRRLCHCRLLEHSIELRLFGHKMPMKFLVGPA